MLTNDGVRIRSIKVNQPIIYIYTRTYTIK